ncbi:energy transducer TonB [Qipengyuania psychrotolerans]|uniref:Energy transducer TonB n=1 Tax=Qipengyuania psychrotolerans TaxID=2867238 RepID=A0ABX8ZHL3_9SPHN|nr:energy transducer TonB [Qipengyuania psychrotolerans]QZD87104.1 energy transducer TonB [Qipengyuania psychrotolerans]
MRGFFLFPLSSILLGIGALTPGIAAAQDGEELFKAAQYPADGKWSLSQTEYSCSVRRDFVKDGDRISLVMRSVQPGIEVQFGVFGEDVSRRKTRISAGFIPSGGQNAVENLADANLGETPGLVFSGFIFPQIAFEIAEGGNPDEAIAKFDSLAAATTHFAIQGLTPEPVALKTNAITQAASALDKCVWGRLAEMGITEKGLAAIRTAPSPRGYAEWSAKVAAVYPKEALREGFQGLVAMRVVVDEQGKPRFCHVADELIAQTLREAACEAMLEHARFEPAKDREGSPVVGLYFQNVRYKFPAGVDAHGMRYE